MRREKTYETQTTKDKIPAEVEEIGGDKKPNPAETVRKKIVATYDDGKIDQIRQGIKVHRTPFPFSEQERPKEDPKPDSFRFPDTRRLPESRR